MWMKNFEVWKTFSGLKTNLRRNKGKINGKTEKIEKKGKKGHNKKALYDAKTLKTDILRI